MDHGPRPVRAPGAVDLDRALAVVRGQLKPTPLIDSPCVPGGLLKLESWQPTGSFKVRGALAALAALPERARRAGVVTASAGNHGLGVAFASARLGVAATVVVPWTASRSKVEALRRQGVTLVQHGADFDAAEAHALELAAEGLTYVSAYNDDQVIAGQATIGPEIAGAVRGPLTVVTPVGGGGLAAGLAIWAARRGEVTLVGVEAAASRAVSTAVAAGRVKTVPVGDTLADGLAGNIEPGTVTPAVLASHATTLTAVSEAQIRAAMRFLAREHGLIVEGSGAAAVAALLAGKVAVTGRPVALVTGRNITLEAFTAAVTPDAGPD